ncbi:hypothetical protein AZI86_01745 [Bdellovibrio bacteriovorus]|uniref:DUF1592 domain-containing protein n=1 Tax=Bdellovibrio bacteriovorus TaxID=959 RepID=A0A150WMX9_BDEBC|nr:DUF1592 domain-containing protein [Bdellovibrio bacteriovorus]KYG65822.1 hypothetical protein AZI86_01745 [Bdellovibrio bacteriovorus]
MKKILERGAFIFMTAGFCFTCVGCNAITEFISPEIENPSITEGETTSPSLTKEEPKSSVSQVSVLLDKQCKKPAAMAVRDSVRLNKLQLGNAIRDTFGEATLNAEAVQAAFAKYPNDVDFETASQFKIMFDQTKLDAVNAIAHAVGEFVASNPLTLASVGGGCFSGITNATAEACYHEFILKLGRLVLRRPLHVPEILNLKKVVSAGLTQKEKVMGITEALLQSAPFLFQFEMGTSLKSEILTLNAFDVASRLSFLILDSVPDATLSQLADSGEILKPAVQRQQVDRLFLDPRAKTKIRRFALYWLGQTSNHAMPSLPTSPPSLVAGLDPVALRTEILREVQEYVEYEIFNGATFKDLLLSTRSFARTDDLASIYGHSKVTSSAPAQMGAGRFGVLLRPILTASTTSTPSSIIRGVRLYSRLFCGSLGSPPAGAEGAGIDITEPEIIKKYSNRTLIEMKTGSGTCFNCHSLANPLGFAFGTMDSFGRFRTTEKIYKFGGADSDLIATHPIDSSAVILTGHNEKFLVNGPQDFAQQLANSQIGPACFSRHMYEFLQVQEESMSDSCLMNEVIKTVQDSNKGVLEAFKEIILSSYLTQKRIN